MKNLFICILFFFGYDGSCQSDFITDKLQLVYGSSDFPGFAAAIVNGDSILYEHGFGFSDVENKKPYHIDTVQNIGSISKTFIGVALMKCVDLGLLSLDSPINDLLGFNIDVPSGNQHDITIRNLATHTSGIVDNEDIYEQTFLLTKYSDASAPLYDFVRSHTLPGRTDATLERFLKNYLIKGGSWYSTKNFGSSKPGMSYQYTNIGAALAALVIEKQSGLPFDEFCRKYIFMPLNMGNTAWHLDDQLALNHARLYNGKQQYYPLYSEITYPDGSLHTTCHDLAVFMREMIAGYNGESLILKPALFQQMFGKQFNDANLPASSDPKEPNSGIFWRIRANGQIGHTGSDLGVTAFMFFDRETRIGKIFMTNIEFDDPKTPETGKKLTSKFKEIWKLLDMYGK